VLISNGDGEANAYALNMLEERGELFVGAQMKVYQGMIIGENAKPDDLEVNPMKAKQLSNVRSSGKDEAIRLTPPRRMTLEQSIAYIDDDEMVEVTPESIRLRKAELDPNERKKMRERDIFKKRVNLKPYEYPELYEYVDAIRHSYWIHTEFKFTSDVDDFHVRVTDVERSAIKHSMLAIAQVEVAVKTFWGDIYKKMPKPEIGAVGATFAESEVRHTDAYSHLLELLGLNDEFTRIKDIPVLQERVNYLDKMVALSRTDENKQYAQSILLFSLFIEHVSLFSQFLIILSFNKHRSMFRGTSNAVEATSKEEQIHGLFGIDIINIIKKEHPEWFDDEMNAKIIQSCKEAYETESRVIDWIYEAGELDFLPSTNVKEFVKNRFNNSLAAIGLSRIFEVNPALLEETDWFDNEVIATKHLDFFEKRSINYNKRSQSVTSEDLF